MRHFLDFEKPVAALEGKIEELRHLGGDSGVNIADEIGKLQTRIEKELEQTYSKLGAWEKVQVARHPDRPKLVQIIDTLFDDFIELSGDRSYAEDYAIIGGWHASEAALLWLLALRKARQLNSVLNVISAWSDLRGIAKQSG